MRIINLSLKTKKVLAAFIMKRLRPLLRSYGIYVSLCFVTYWPQQRSDKNPNLTGYLIDYEAMSILKTKQNKKLNKYSR